MDTTPSQKLRFLLRTDRTEYILEAHNALSAVIAESAGISGLWGSSLTISASWGMRDANELSMTQVLDILEAMTDRVDIPVLFDGDTGYGNFNQFRRLVTGLCRRSVAGVCIEDKIFPKTNSFINSESQRLAPVEEFCGKIRAGKDAQTSDDFVIAARTEAFIVGMGLEAALERAHKYVDAGADAILVHSKSKTFDQVSSFMARWDRDTPIICVPTTYDKTTHEDFEQAGVSLVIWANHMLRASIQAMEQTAAAVARTSSVREVVTGMATVPAIFQLQNAAELSEAEVRYNTAKGHAGVILAASRADAADSQAPRCLTSVGGEPVLHKLLRQLRSEGVRDISVVRGHAPEAYTADGVSYHDHPAWQKTGDLAAQAHAREALTDSVLVSYGHIAVKPYILHEVLASTAALTIVVDAGPTSGPTHGTTADRRVQATVAAPRHYGEQESFLLQMGPEVADGDAHGRWTGLLHARGEGANLLRETLGQLLDSEGGETLDMDALLNHLVRKQDVKIRVFYIRGDWFDIDTMKDVDPTRV
jgi:phosphoenolpyruvate phosphomutase